MDRYRGIIDDWDAFTTAVQQSPRQIIRRNPLKAGDDFPAQLTEMFPAVEQADWNTAIWRPPHTARPGKTWMHWRGDYYVQEESATVPVTVLDPQPGETVLDMAAAPGGKTTQIAAHMQNTGLVVANEKNGKRMKSLHANVNRLGAACVAATNYDGRNMPEQETYDRILVDAPCSAEVDRAHRGKGAATEAQLASLSIIQKGLCVKAARLLKPGGRLVYSTCTIAPEENEAVVDHVLDETGLSLTPVDTPVPHVPGITEFNGQTFSDKLEQTARIYPHHMDSGGMYIACFTN